jgi:peptide/nickel transport system permease protein
MSDTIPDTDAGLDAAPGPAVLAPSDPPAVVHPRRRSRRAGVLSSPGGRLGVALLLVVVAVALAGPRLVGTDPFASVGPALAAPSVAHPMGTDDLGRDVVRLVVHGTRTSLLVGLGTMLVSAVIAMAVGAVGGFRPGRLDDLLMRGTELVQVVPRFFLAVVVVALFGPTLPNLIALLGLTSWTWTARVVRAETLSLRERDFVEAARSLGGGDGHILRRHIAPNVLPSTLVMLSVCASGAILVEAGLGFVGLSDPDVVSLGTLASNAQRFLRTAWWLAVFPGAALLLIVVGINLVGDAVGDAHGDRLGRGRFTDRASGQRSARGKAA